VAAVVGADQLMGHRIQRQRRHGGRELGSCHHLEAGRVHRQEPAAQTDPEEVAPGHHDRLLVGGHAEVGGAVHDEGLEVRRVDGPDATGAGRHVEQLVISAEGQGAAVVLQAQDVGQVDAPHAAPGRGQRVHEPVLPRPSVRAHGLVEGEEQVLAARVDLGAARPRHRLVDPGGLVAQVQREADVAGREIERADAVAGGVVGR